MVRFYRILFVDKHYTMLSMDFALSLQDAVRYAEVMLDRAHRRPVPWSRIIVAEVDVYADCKRNTSRHILTLELGA